MDTNSKEILRLFKRSKLDLPVIVKTGRSEILEKASLKDIGLGGLSFRSSLHLEKGAIVEITLPNISTAFHSLAKVLWTKKEDGHYLTGVEFYLHNEKQVLEAVQKLQNI